MFWVALFAAVSFVLRDIAGLDASVGAFGNWFADFLCGLLGIGAYILPLFLIVLSLKWKHFVREELLGKKIFLSTSFLLLLSGIIHVFQDADRVLRVSSSAILYAQGVSRAGGGFFGGFVGEWLGYCLRLPGTCLLAIPLLVIVGIYLVGLTPSTLWQRIEVKFKMLRQRRREERGANGDKLSAASARHSLGKGKGKASADWKEPQPLKHGAVYDFGEDEPDTVIDPVRGDAKKEIGDAAEESESLRAEGVKQPSRVSLSSEVNELLDLPDDEPDFIEPSAEARTILSQAGHTDDTWQQVDEILRDITDATALREDAATPPADAPTAREEGKQGSYYAPFALPVRPEPRRDRAATSSENSALDALHVTEPTAATEIVDDTRMADTLVEETLGSTRPEGYVPERTFAYGSTPQNEEQIPPSPKQEAAPKSDDEDIFKALPDTDAVSPLSDREQATAAASVLDALLDEDEQQDAGDASAYDEPGAKEEESTFFFSDDAAEPEDVAIPVPATYTRVAPMAEPAAPAFVAPAAPRFASPNHSPIIEKTPIRDEVPEPPVAVRREYVHPPITLLNEDKNVRNDNFYEEIEDTKQILRDTLESFNIHIQEEVAYSHGPSVTRYELRPVAGTSVRSVTNRIEDISLNLASAVRIEAPIPGKPAIGIEVPNKVRETVYMRTMLESEEFKGSTEPLEVPLGLDVGGAVKLCNLAKMPHLLVAGTTGSGKSVCINSILVSLIYKTSPEDLRLILIDPKQIEFAPYEHVPHLYMPIVTDMQRAAGALACAVQEMERRFTLIKDVGVRNIEAYNEAVKNDPDREHLPYMIIVIDEFADLKMSCSNNDPENFTCRIAQKARAAGIHLIIGTQRPSVDVITGKLKSNIPSRIAFMVKQQVDSRTILDVNGAEALTGRGDMLYMPSNSSDKAPNRIQGAFVSDGELERVISYVRKNNDPVQYNQAFMDQIEIEMARAQNNGKKHDMDEFDEGTEGSEDPKFVEAVKLAVETQKVATSLLQRRLGVGYGRAAKIIDRMEELGLVSAAEGNKPRQILPMAQGYLNHLAVEEEGTSDDFYE